jgi:hypothetical protein
VTATAKPMAIGGVLLHAALFLLLGALALGLGTLMPLWVATLLVGVMVAAAGGLLAWQGARNAKTIGQAPLVRTKREITEDRTWMNETRAALAAKIRNAKLALSGDVSPSSRPS